MYSFYSDLRWAQDVAQPKLAQRIAVNDYFGAFELASEMEERLGETPALDPVWRAISANANFETEPPGPWCRSYATTTQMRPGPRLEPRLSPRAGSIDRYLGPVRDSSQGDSVSH